MSKKLNISIIFNDPVQYAAGPIYEGTEVDIDTLDEAIDIFKLNVEAYPRSANVYDSLAEAYLKKGNKELAIKFYSKAVEINPNFASSIEALRQLKN